MTRTPDSHCSTCRQSRRRGSRSRHGVAQAREKLFGPLREALERYTLASHRERLELVPATLGEQAGVIGAGLLAWKASGAPR